MRVIVECCLQEKVFNKYYTILASKLCRHDKNHKFTLQYCLWDHFKELESAELIRSMNLARFVVEMLASFSISLSVLKVVELSNPNQLTPRRRMHFRMLFGAIFEFSDAMVWNIFTRIALTSELESLRNGIEFFIKQYMVNTNKTLSTKFKIARKALNNVDGVLIQISIFPRHKLMASVAWKLGLDENLVKKCEVGLVLHFSVRREVRDSDVDSGEDRSIKQPPLPKGLKVQLDSSSVPAQTEVLPIAKEKLKKRKSKTKFEEYLEMDMKKGIASAEEDLELERKLAKKLKVKGGKLRGVDDGINILFDGIPSALVSLEDNEIPDDEEDYKNVKSPRHSSVSKKGKMRKLSDAPEQVPEDVVASNTSAEGVEQVESIVAEVAPEELSVKAPALDGRRKYVPPQLRSLVRNESDEYTQFRRSVKGLLNKFSESNLESMTKEMSTIFRMVGRSVASQIISEEILGFCSQGPRGNEQFAAVFAAFVAGMACSVGMDFSARLLASLAKSFEDEYEEEDNLSMRILTLLLSYLCIFGVCASDLIYDFLILLGKRLMEVDVSTILTILQCCGMKLRGDDPAAMKDFILSVQNRVNELKSSSMVDGHPKIDNRRMEFMLETISDIKNNKKRSKEDPASHSWIKKWLQKLQVEDILLRGLKWSKLLDPHKKGQWWLSGEMVSSTDNVEVVASMIDREVLETQKFMQLAAAQRMNTDARRAIFSVIMSSEDYIDAFEKLLRLDLPGKQDREIMRVIVECCLQEKVFNKYYTILASKLCCHDKNHKFTLQYCLWDHFKELESAELIRSMNLARFVVEMLASFSISLSVLKVVELSNPNQLTPRRRMHFRMLFGAIFEFSDAMVWNIFTRIALTSELESLRNGIEFFIKQYMVNTNKTLSTKFKIARKALNNVDGVLM